MAHETTSDGDVPGNKDGDVEGDVVIDISDEPILARGCPDVADAQAVSAWNGALIRLIVFKARDENWNLFDFDLGLQALADWVRRVEDPVAEAADADLAERILDPGCPLGDDVAGTEAWCRATTRLVRDRFVAEGWSLDTLSAGLRLFADWVKSPDGPSSWPDWSRSPGR